MDLERLVKMHDSQTFYLLRTVPGVGKIIALTLLYEIGSIERFPHVKDFIGYRAE